MPSALLSTGAAGAGSMATAAESAFAPALVDWQRRHGRHDLPWQNTRDAYRIWLSEIMLQQTQVATVIPYYRRFLQKFPANATLAAAPADEVLAHWAGLGYYARARHLHRCAQVVEQQHGGRFPADPAALAELPGIGRSTAAAIAVFSAGARAAILDGNVKRVLTRCFGIAGYPGLPAVERQLWALAERLLPASAVESYTQGLMDLGATLCTRAKPRCADCPLAAQCVARRDGRCAELPTRKTRRAVPQRQSRVLLLLRDGGVLLEVRPPAGIWGGLWALPEVREDETPVGAARRFGCEVDRLESLPTRHHAFTHFRLELQPWRGTVLTTAAGTVRESDAWRWLPLTELASAPLPAPVLRLLRSSAAPAGEGD